MEGTANWTVYFYYNVRAKGHYAENWIPFYYYGDYEFPTQSNSDYTTIIYPLHLSPTHPEQGYILEHLSGLPSNAQVDFQIEAMKGYFHRGYNPNATDQLQMWEWIFTGETSGWSSTQTITLPTSTSSPASSPSPTSTSDQTPTPTPSQESPQTELTTIIGVAIVTVVLGAGLGLLVYFKKRSRGQPA
jgi:hypothetical protein